MKKSALRFGLYGVYLLLIFFFIEWLIYRNGTQNWEVREIVGWAGILLSTVFVFFGLKYYRDIQNNGDLSFGDGIKLGLLITLFPAVAFGVFNVFYMLVLDPDFLETYYNHQVEQIANTVPAAELDSKMKEVEEAKEMFARPLIQFIAMFLSVFFVGVIVTAVSTLILKRKRIQPV